MGKETGSPAWLASAMRVLECAGHGDTELALDETRRLMKEHGPDGLAGAMKAWIDVLRTIAAGQQAGMLSAVQHKRLRDRDGDPTELWALGMLDASERFDMDQLQELSVEIAKAEGPVPMASVVVLARIVARNSMSAIDAGTGQWLRAAADSPR